MSERTAAFCDRHPLFVAALYCVVVIGLGAWSPTLAVVAATALAAAAWRINGWRMAAGWMCCATFAVTVMTARERHRVAAGERLVAGAVGEARGQLTEDARQQGRYWSAPVRLKGGPCSGTKVWWEGSGEPPVAGALVTGKGGFEPLPVTRNPGEFDRGSWLRQRGIAAVFFAGRMPGTVEVPTATRLGATIRHGLRDRIIAGLEEPSKSADIIRAVVIGEKPRDGKELVESFRNSGTLHVFTVSGLHVALVATIGWLALSFAGVTRRRAVIVLVPLVFAYAWATGNEAPAVRSAWMTTVFLGAFVWRRRPDLLNSLGAVLLAALLWDGRLLFLPGVQLSYGVVAAIALAAGPASNCFAWMARPELYLPVELMSRWQLRWWRFRRRLAQSLGVSLAAAVGSAPLTAWHFGLFTPVSV
ncbi:MAG: ComEC/Rec2 family competence protein, partial [Verrucomicrobiae bacterium]|nr:ComEC/Rec2 family competence protein [Verrucomicrobiae bacterium]